MAYSVMAGILGDLRYDNNRHYWAFDVGIRLGDFEILCRLPNGAKSPEIVKTKNERRGSINCSLDRKNIKYNLPDITFGDNEIDGIVPDIVGKTQENQSLEECVFISIASAFRLLTEGIRISSVNKKHDIRVKAQKRIQDIGVKFPFLKFQPSPFWELLHQKSRVLQDYILCNNSIVVEDDINILRTLFDSLQNNLVILVLCTYPPDQDELHRDHECVKLQNSIEDTTFRSYFEVHYQPGCTVADITTAFNKSNPTIAHFSGHGSSEGLCVKGEDNKAKLLKVQDLARILGRQKLKAVVLNKCCCDFQAQWMAQNVGYVLTMEDEAHDEDAISFIRLFYSVLRYCGSIDEAFAEAKSQMGVGNKTLKPKLLTPVMSSEKIPTIMAKIQELEQEISLIKKTTANLARRSYN
jgi:hypothetical protein